MIEHKLNETPLQLNAIREGLTNIVPVPILSVFTWQELERTVCGSPDIDLEIIKKNTVYTDGITASHPHVQYFWNVLENTKLPSDRADFLRFVWARSRLPTRTSSTLPGQVFQNCVLTLLRP